MKLTYNDKNKNNEVLNGTVDSDFAGKSLDQKSTSGYMIRCSEIKSLEDSWTNCGYGMFGFCLICCYVRSGDCLTWFLRSLSIDLSDLKLEKPIKIYQDDSRAVAVAKQANFKINSKQIEVQYYYTASSKSHRTHL